MMTRSRWLQVGGAAFIAIFLGTFNSAPLVELVRQPVYYRDIIITLFQALLIFTYIDLVTIWLNNRLSWQTKFISRLVTQIAFGLGGATALAYSFAYLHYRFIDSEHVFGTDSFLKTEFPVILLFMLFINSLFSGIAYYQELTQKEPNQVETATKEAQFATTLLGIQGNRKIAVPIDTVALISVEHGITWLFTFNNTRYHLDEPLQKVAERLDPVKFFRVNRQHIVQLAACFSYQSADFGKIKLTLTPPFTTELTISQKTASTFRKWMDR
ncbi:LytTR family DNA-binding domain-containing protein [Spirosoma profusum]|nr:LytTR family DNA-binding domain-containing protein [Spirosoma profusum]